MGGSMRKEAEETYKERQERIEATINLKIPDRVPVYFNEDGYAWVNAGISIMDYMNDNDKMMIALEKFHKDFPVDAQTYPPAPMDPLTLVVGQPTLIRLPGKELPPNATHQAVETEIMKEEDYGYAIENGYMQLLIKLLPKLRPGVPEVQQRFQDMMAARSSLTLTNMKILKEDGIPCLYGSGIESPFTLLSLMRSYEKFCLDVFRHPEIVSRTLDKFTEEIIEMSVDGCRFMGIPRAIICMHRECSSFFSLKQFEQFGLPEMKKIVQAFSREGITTVFHCDGNWTPNLPYLKELPKGKCFLELDNFTDIFKAKEILGDRMCFAGNLMELTLSRDTPSKIEENCKNLIDVVGRDGGLILRGEPSPEAKPGNLMAMINTAKEYGVYKT
jgi:uroporphyrinogen-III decarboxylase